MELVANLVTRPQRVHYDLDELGPVSFVLNDTRVNRVDLAVMSKHGVTLAASHYIPEGVTVCQEPVVVYCHGSSGSRMEALDVVEHLLERKISLFCFDFSGAGISGFFQSCNHVIATALELRLQILPSTQSTDPACLIYCYHPASNHCMFSPQCRR